MKEKVTICTGGPNVVFATTKHPEEAMEWLKWYYQEENSWSLIEAGTWMPILDSWYTDAEKTDKWIDNPNFPDKDMYKSAVVDYAKDNMVSTSWYYVNGTDESTLLWILYSPMYGPDSRPCRKQLMRIWKSYRESTRLTTSNTITATMYWDNITGGLQ